MDYFCEGLLVEWDKEKTQSLHFMNLLKWLTFEFYTSWVIVLFHFQAYRAGLTWAHLNNWSLCSLEDGIKYTGESFWWSQTVSAFDIIYVCEKFRVDTSHSSMYERP